VGVRVLRNGAGAGKETNRSLPPDLLNKLWSLGLQLAISSMSRRESRRRARFIGVKTWAKRALRIVFVRGGTRESCRFEASSDAIKSLRLREKIRIYGKRYCRIRTKDFSKGGSMPMGTKRRRKGPGETPVAPTLHRGVSDLKWGGRRGKKD